MKKNLKLFVSGSFSLHFPYKNGGCNGHLGEVSPVDLVLLDVKEERCHR